MNSNNSSIDVAKKLQPEMEIFNRKYKVTSTRVLAAALRTHTRTKRIEDGKVADVVRTEWPGEKPRPL